MRSPFHLQAPSSAERKGSIHVRLVGGLASMALSLSACAGAGSPSLTSSPYFAPSGRSTATAEPTSSPNPSFIPSATLAAGTLLPPTSPPAPTATPEPTGTPEPTASYPLKITDDEGTDVRIPAEPRHIISLSPATTEILFALGAGSRVVGGTDQDDYPAEAAAIPDVASFTGVALDKVTALEPDLVLAGGNGFTPPDAIKRMRDLHFPVVVVYAKTVDDVLADIRLIGRAAGEPAAADQIVGDMRARMNVVTSAVAGTTGKPRTFYEIGFGPDIYAPAPGFFTTQMIDLAGGDPITTGDPNVFSIPLEKLVAADPEVIVVGDALYGTCPADIEARRGWSTMTAVKAGAIRPVNDIVVTRPGPRLPDGLASLARAIHPELSLSGFAPDPPLCTGPGASQSPGASASASP